MNPRIWRMFGLLGLVALALGAQEPPSAPAASAFGSSVDVRVVNVEAVITDSKGERVRGLSAADLKLEVDGREVPIEYFAEIAEGQPVFAASAPASPSGGVTPGLPPPPSQAPQGRSFLVFIDEAFAVAKQRDIVLQALERDLKLFGPEDRMAIVAFGAVKIGGSRLDVLSGWTGDTQALAAALRAARKRPASGNDVMATRRSLENDQELVQQGFASTGTDPYETDYAGARGFDSVVPNADGGDAPRFLAVQAFAGRGDRDERHGAALRPPDPAPPLRRLARAELPHPAGGRGQPARLHDLSRGRAGGRHIDRRQRRQPPVTRPAA